MHVIDVILRNEVASEALPIPLPNCPKCDENSLALTGRRLVQCTNCRWWVRNTPGTNDWIIGTKGPHKKRSKASTL